MSGFTNRLRDDLLDEVFGGVNFTPDSTLYIGLSTTAPNDNGGNISEPSDGYGRVSVTNDKTNWTNSTDGVLSNNAVFEFPEATGTWGTVSHFFIANDPSLTGNSILAWGELTLAKSVDTGDTARFREGDLTITLS